VSQRLARRGVTGNRSGTPRLAWEPVYEPELDPAAGGVPLGAPDELAEPDEPDFVPMFGQFFDDGADPVDELDGVVLDEFEEFDEFAEPLVELPDVEPVPVVEPVLLVLLVAVVLGVEDVDAALAARAPPAMRPPVSALVASTVRSRSFIGDSFSLHQPAGHPGGGEP
jgi:hypothetical protein